MSDPLCGTCRHWHRQSPPRAASVPADQPQGAVDLSGPKVGECRRMPPQLFALALGVLPNGQIQNQLKVGYPPLSDDTPGCGEHKPVAALVTG